MSNITGGVWATMITPFTQENKIDYAAVESLVEWYIKNGVDGIFAVCQSSEMFWLSFDERYELAEFVIRAAADRAEVVVSGNVGENIETQIKEARAFAELSPQAVVFVSNRLERGGGDFLRNADKIMKEMPENVSLGIYECPHPSKRLLTDAECGYLAKSGRFAFLKDTSCDAEIMRKRIRIVSGTDFKLYNANAATLYETLKFGYSGYCGVMANFHPDLYAWLYKNLNRAESERIEKYLALSSVIESRNYPCCAKRYLARFEGVAMNTLCRSCSSEISPALDFELKALCEVSRETRERIKNY